MTARMFSLFRGDRRNESKRNNTATEGFVPLNFKEQAVEVSSEEVKDWLLNIPESVVREVLREVISKRPEIALIAADCSPRDDDYDDLEEVAHMAGRLSSAEDVFMNYEGPCSFDEAPTPPEGAAAEGAGAAAGTDGAEESPKEGATESPEEKTGPAEGAAEGADGEKGSAEGAEGAAEVGVKGAADGASEHAVGAAESPATGTTEGAKEGATEGDDADRKKGAEGARDKEASSAKSTDGGTMGSDEGSKVAGSPADDQGEDQAQELRIPLLGVGGAEGRPEDEECRNADGQQPKKFPPPLNAPVLQFSSSKYMCSEEEGSILVEVLRLGRIDEGMETRVGYTTVDQSAIAGIHYFKTEGVLTFGPSETEKQIEVKLVDDGSWSSMNEFHVVLKDEGLHNAVLNDYMHVARVQRIDDDCYPTNKYKDAITRGQEETLNPVFLFFEYFRFNFHLPLVRRGTIKMLIIDQLLNICGLITLLCQVFLVDHILSKESADDPMLFGLDAKMALSMLVVARLVPLALSTVLSYMRTDCGIGGNCRKNLSTGLVDAFMNYDDSSRKEVNAADLISAMTDGTEVLIQVGYMNFIKVIRLLGKLVLHILFQVFIHESAQKSRHSQLSLLVMIMAPALMFSSGFMRYGATKSHLRARIDARKTLFDHVSYIVANFRLIADYGKRFSTLSDHSQNLTILSASAKQVSKAEVIDQFLMKWANALTTSIYLIAGGMEVIRGNLPIGVFLVCLKVCMSVGDMWEEVYTTLSETFNNSPALTRCLRLMNLPSNSRNRMTWDRKKLERFTEFRKAALAETSTTGLNLCENVPLKVQQIRLTLRAMSLLHSNKKIVHRTTLLKFPELVIQQGHLVALVGMSGLGKSFLMRLLGGAVLPDMDCLEEGVFCIPVHLRLLHISPDTMFIKGTLYDNLVFGVHPRHMHTDGRMQRVQKVCKRLGLSQEIIDGVAKNDDSMGLAWVESLSSMDKRLLVIARALVANPKVLCIHDPTAGLPARAGDKVMTALREFVDKRGFELDDHVVAPGDADNKPYSGPCTCIITSTAEKCSMVDAAWEINGLSGHIAAVEVHRPEKN